MATTKIAEPEAEILVERVPIPKLTKKQIEQERPSVEYLALATKLGTGFQTTLTRERMEDILRENGLAAFPLDRVAAFMTAKVVKLNRGKRRHWRAFAWGWHPLTQADLDHRPTRMMKTLTKVYRRRVPIEVLMTVDKLREEIGSQAKFFVADIYSQREPAPKEDPFLAVTAKGLPLYIIERWNEPAFRM
jgi:hypothetical protein